MLGLLGDEPEVLERLFSGDPFGPAPLTASERDRLAQPAPAAPSWVEAGVPEWLAGLLAGRFGEDWIVEARAATLGRAPVDLRVNQLRGPAKGALKLLKMEGVEPEPTPFSALGLRLPPAFATDVHTLKAFTTGWIEVQDEASQIAAALAGARAGEIVVDYCAGAGGKTLALAASLKGEGRLIASDIDSRRLLAMKERLVRAGARAELRTLGRGGEGMEDLQDGVDLVFVDAPCTGSGTWRRHPEAAWRLTQETLARLGRVQAAVLAQAARLVRPGGRLVYATCSLLEEENEAVADAFAAGHPQFQPRPVADLLDVAELRVEGRRRLAALAGGRHTIQLTPERTGTDGFFAAYFERFA
jgi:16S rRNA (cytosine967-C5)-methyltransferase